jgi:hypothetical protein
MLGESLEPVPSFLALIGEPVNHVWFSDYSICYLELGELKPGRTLPNGQLGSPSGEFTLFLGYDWNVEFGGLHRSRLDLHGNDIERESLMAQFQGAVVRSVDLVAGSSEIEIRLSTNIVLRTASADGEDPSWSISS